MKNQVKNLVFAAVCTAIGVVLPSLFHIFGWSGIMLLPMHIPVLLCGFICGWEYGGLCGIIVPLLCSLLTGMPPLFPTGTAMMVELCAYGVLSGLLYKKFNVYVSLLGAMVGGRVINGLVSTVLYGIAGKPYAFATFISGAFVTVLPGIIIQIVLIPALVLTLTKAGLIDDRRKKRI